MNIFIRTVKGYDLDEVSNHLLVVGDLKGDCFNCKEIGLNYSEVKSCPKCKTEFRFIGSRKTSNLGIKDLSTLHKKRPDLVCIEYSELKLYQDRARARDLLS